ncbi:MAG: hypothetical protein EOO48_03310 [Flavobacterium sp.]|nr:MAG: hypothetical protein EOO48_03310 [Flavobacterium sp.]
MNKLFTFLGAALFSATAIAQTPNKISYQSVIRDNKGILVSEKPISIEITILRGRADGEVIYVERHHVRTNKNGLANLEIGTGESVTGNFQDINWGDGPYFVKTATDSKGGTNFNIVGVSELTAVPYALHARSVDNMFSGNYNDLANKPVKLSQFINDLGATATPTVGVPSNNWALQGNSSSNPLTDKLGTTDAKDLVIVTNNIDRFRIKANGDIDLKKSLQVGEDLNVNKNVNLNILGGQTINNGNLTVANGSFTQLTGALDVDKTLNVDKATTLQSTLDVNNGSATHFTGTLDVDRTLNVDMATSLQAKLDVLNQAPTHLTGTLDVDGTMSVNSALAVQGTTNLNGTLNVNNGSATHLTGNLDVDGTANVDGATDLKSTLTVDGATNLKSTLVVTGTTNLNSTLSVNNGAATHLTGATDVDTTLNVDGLTSLQQGLNVNNASATHLTGALATDGATTLNGTLSAKGQVTISTSVSGGDASYAAHPLRVEGSAQGIAIKLTAATPDNSNNFITFFNNSGSAVGRIEGETAEEAVTDPEYIFTNAMLVAEEVKAGVNVGTSTIPVAVAGVGVSAGPCGACIAAAAADLVLATANLAAYNVFALENLGVTYQSGSADYAEWLERSNSGEKIFAGEIVGVRGGKISKFTKDAQQFMVISTKPAILGNMPSAGQENLYEKVAFMGQIPVKVRGLVLSGDYILPSGLNDGTGIAVSPENIKPEQYKEIVGLAWSNSLMNGGVSTVNMAIGLNSNDLANLALIQEKKIAALEAKYQSFEQRLTALESGKPADVKIAEPKSVPAQVASTEKSKYEIMASNMPAELSPEIMADAFAYLQNAYAKQGLNIKSHPGLDRLFNNAAYKAEITKKAQEAYKISYQKIQEMARMKN